MTPHPLIASALALPSDRAPIAAPLVRMEKIALLSAMLRNVAKAAVLPLRKYARYAGRSSRMEFWSYMVAVSVLHIVVAVVLAPISWALFLALLLPSLAVLVRRLHDVGRSCWWVFPMPVLSIVLIFLYGATGFMLGDEAGAKVFIGIGISFLAFTVLGTTLLVWTCRRGTPGSNRFGVPPQTTSDQVSTVCKTEPQRIEVGKVA